MRSMRRQVQISIQSQKVFAFRETQQTYQQHNVRSGDSSNTGHHGRETNTSVPAKFSKQ